MKADEALEQAVSTWRTKHQIREDDPMLAALDLVRVYLAHAPLPAREAAEVPRTYAEFRETVELLDRRAHAFGKQSLDLIVELRKVAERRSRVSQRLYDKAVQLTGIDATTLHHYAYVARRVPRSLRNEHVSWDHHRKVAKFHNETEKRRWLAVAADKQLAGQPMSLRRFARSIQAGRLLTPGEVVQESADTGIENVHPYVNRIVAFFGRLKSAGWLANADEHERAALKRDLQPIIDIHHEL